MPRIQGQAHVRGVLLANNIGLEWGSTADMLKFLFGRLAIMVPTLFLVTVIAFSLQNLLPGDPVIAMAGENRDPEVLAHLRARYNLDKPLPGQYGIWLGRVLHGDLRQ